MSEEQDSLFEIEDVLEEDIIDDEVFVGPVTAKELEITWRKRLAYGNPSKRTERMESSHQVEKKPNSVNALQPINTFDSIVLQENTAPSSIIKPAKLVVQAAPLDYKWARKINMKKINKPKRPEYMLSPSKQYLNCNIKCWPFCDNL